MAHAQPDVLAELLAAPRSCCTVRGDRNHAATRSQSFIKSKCSPKGSRFAEPVLISTALPVWLGNPHIPAGPIFPTVHICPPGIQDSNCPTPVGPIRPTRGLFQEDEVGRAGPVSRPGLK